MNPFHWLAQLPTTVLQMAALPAYLLVGGLVFAEDALFVGFALPGETAAILGGVTASVGHTSLPVMWVVVVGAAILGDSVGYEIGRIFLGPRLETSRWAIRHADRIERGRALLRRHGGVAVLIGRGTAVLRALMPALAGASGMRYRTFLLWNSVGGVLWGTACVVLGYLAGSSWQHFAHGIARAGLVLVVLVAVVFVVRRRTGRRRNAAPSETVR